ncbi:response regulator transcription factor [Streptomyces montanisoli]|uniref:Response regulator transcription factor n=1 Tax=Streptomyces montanisoli TaxID=2798581 RepID=A0A940MEJ6_9ACTN|nr:response regulator transcription factor [Streptomyces montanisoli]MBP0458555.1 response regulator transcription factor [Streptomyces montanisoli]
MQEPVPPAGLRVLVVEDDDVIGRHLETGLTGGGYAPTWCRTAGGALGEVARSAAYDVVILDLGLPDADGLDVARHLRTHLPGTLIVILTARSEEIDVIAGLDAGADDYLQKPFSLSVLMARLRAHLRRRPAPSPAEPPILLGGLTMDLQARRCLVGGSELVLRPKEFDLLTALARRADAAVSREELMAQVWDENWFGPTKTLDVTMASLRRKLATAQASASSLCLLPHITTLRGHGYRLETTPETKPPPPAVA